MCDYSLEFYQSRPARVGEEYTTQRFASGTIGFVAPESATTAVCLECGQQLRLKNVPTYLQKDGIGPDEVVTFTRLHTGPHHDGVRFANGFEATLQQLGPGVKGIVSEFADESDALDIEPLDTTLVDA